MFVQKIAGCSAAAVIASLMTLGSAQAAMYPFAAYGDQNVHHVPDVHPVDCAVGFHIGPAGGCVLGTDNPPPPADRVIEHRSVDEGCQTKSVKREDADGNSETHTKTNCD